LYAKKLLAHFFSFNAYIMCLLGNLLEPHLPVEKLTDRAHEIYTVNFYLFSAATLKII